VAPEPRFGLLTRQDEDREDMFLKGVIAVVESGLFFCCSIVVFALRFGT